MCIHICIIKVLYALVSLRVCFIHRMAPKAQKGKPTKKTDKTEEQIMSEPRHNMVAFLDPEGKVDGYKEIMQWLKESRVNKAVTFSTPVYKSLIKAFWETAKIIEVDGKEVIQGQMTQMLHSPFRSCGCLLRMKYTGDIFAGQINKANLPLRYKFLMYVLIQCLRKSRAGYDKAGNDLVGLLVALILNKPFSISQFIFGNMKDNLRRTGTRTSGNKFWMYPRFMQMIINIQHLDIPKAANDILKIDAMLENSLWIFKRFSAKRYKESDPPRKMFGALLNKAYVALANDKWRHDDSQSDDEEPELEKMMKEKFKRKRDSSDSSDSGGDGDGGDAGATAASAPGASSAGVDEQEGSEKDTETERLQKKKTVVLRKKKAKKNIGTSSSAQ
ncbi:hypothetical protein Hanom_Chr07g00644001 [Helianthus anomalus]